MGKDHAEKAQSLKNADERGASSQSGEPTRAAQPIFGKSNVSPPVSRQIIFNQSCSDTREGNHGFIECT